MLTALLSGFRSVNAQTVNWAALNEENKHIVNASFGYEYGFVYGLGYGYQIKTRLFPIIADIDYSSPSGDNIIDDFKTRIGGQIRWIEFNNFQFSTQIKSVFRRYDNDLSRLVNFGCVVGGVFGYYRPKWFVSGEFGFDKAIVTHLKQSQKYKDQYPDAVSGWYLPTGGNFFYGIQSGYSFRSSEVNIKIGKMINQDLKTTPIIPYYMQLGYNLKF